MPSAVSANTSPAPRARIALYCPSLPPARGGVADHTLYLARALEARSAPVAVLGLTGDPDLFRPIETRTGITPLGNAHGLVSAAREIGATAVLVQYVPFLYARFGLSPALVRALWGLRRGGAKVAVFLHEPYVPFTRPTWWITGWPMRWQFRAVIRLADLVLTPVPHFLELARRVARPGTRLALAPVGATIPVAAGTRAEARTALGLGDGDVAVGVFSPRASGSRASWITRAAVALRGTPVRWFFFGGGSEAPPDGFPADVPARCLGWLEPAGTSRMFRALDIVAAPFDDGLTLRRTSAMAALAHGLALVTSRGALFDPALAEAAICAGTAGEFSEAVQRLAGDPGLRDGQGRRGLAFYADHGSVEVLAAQVQRELAGAAA